MEETERKILYMKCCFDVLNRPMPMQGVKIDIMEAMGLLEIYVARGAIPNFNSWESSTFGTEHEEEEEEAFGWPESANLTWLKACNPELYKAG